MCFCMYKPVCAENKYMHVPSIYIYIYICIEHWFFCLLYASDSLFPSLRYARNPIDINSRSFHIKIAHHFGSLDEFSNFRSQWASNKF